MHFFEHDKKKEEHAPEKADDAPKAEEAAKTDAGDAKATPTDGGDGKASDDHKEAGTIVSMKRGDYMIHVYIE
jgi:hypothetical protein